MNETQGEGDAPRAGPFSGAVKELLLRLQQGLISEEQFLAEVHRQSDNKSTVTSTLSSAQCPLQGIDLRQLPSFLAIPLRQWEEEDHPVQRLWRICDAVEILVRYITILGIAEEVQRGGGKLPPDLARTLAGSIRRPTFGVWLGLAKCVLEYADPRGPLRETAHSSFFDCVEPLVGHDKDTPETHVGPLRNYLAHGGGITRAAALLLLQSHGHEARAQRLFRELHPWLSQHRLIFVEECGACLELRGLQGPKPAEGQADPATVWLQEFQGQVVLLLDRDGPCWSLWPLFGYGLPEVPGSGRRSRTGTQPLPQIYIKEQSASLFYNVLGGDFPYSETSGSALDCFKRLFRPDLGQGAIARSSAFDFTDRLVDSADDRVGREAELTQIVEAIQSCSGGILWIQGRAGAGKSTLMAAVACHPRIGGQFPRIELPKGGGNRNKLLVVVHLFKVGDSRCSRIAFLRQAVGLLQTWPPLCTMTPSAKPDGQGLEPETPVDVEQIDPATLEKRFRLLLERAGSLQPASDHPQARAPRVLFILDGLDEIARSDPSFINCPFESPQPNIVWLCAGRPEPELVLRYHSKEVTALFPISDANLQGDLPSMSPADIRGMLMTGAERYQLLRLDTEVGDRVQNEFLDAVVERSAGLPIYIQMVLVDLRTRELHPDDPNSLPPSLDDYYEELLRRYSIGDLNMVLTPMVATLAIAQEPLDENSLFSILAYRNLVTATNEGSGLVQRAIRVLGSMLRLAPMPQGGHGYTLYHDTFRSHVLSSPLTSQAVATARQSLANAAADWAKPLLLATRPYLWRNGIASLLESGRSTEAETLLCDLPFAEGMVIAAGPSALATAYNKTALALPHNAPRLRLLQLIAEAVGLDLGFLHRHPNHLFQTLWNRCWWYDCPDAAHHYREPQGGWQKPQPWDRPGEKLYRLMEEWRRVKEIEPGFVWIRSLRPSPENLGTGLKQILRGHQRRSFRFDSVLDVAWCPDGRRLASASRDDIQVCDIKTGETVPVGATLINGLAWSPDGLTLATSTGSVCESIHLWDARSGSLRDFDGCFRCADPKRLMKDGSSLAWSPNRRWLASTAAGNNIRVWDVQSGSILRRLEGHIDAVVKVAWGPDGRCLISASCDGTLRLWDVEAGTLLKVFDAESPQISVVWEPGGQRIVSGSSDGRLCLWDLGSGETLSVIDAGTGSVVSLDWSPDRRSLVWISGDSIHLWDFAKRRMARTIEVQAGVRCVAWSMDSQYVAAGCRDGAVRVFDTEKLEDLYTLEKMATSVKWSSYKPPGVLWSSDGRYLASESGDYVLLWDASSGILLHRLAGHTQGLTNLAWSPMASHLASSSSDGTVRLWDARTGVELRVWNGDDTRQCLTWNSDGRHLACGSRNSVKVWDAENGSLVIEFLMVCPDRQAVRMTWSPDGRLLATSAHEYQTVMVWDIESGALLNLLEPEHAHEGDSVVFCLAWSPDGKRIAAGQGGVVRIWDLATSTSPLALYCSSMVRSIAWSLDSKLVASILFDGSMRLWNLDTGEVEDESQGDPAQFSQNLEECTWLALARGPDMVVLRRADKEALASFPLRLEWPAINSRKIVGRAGSYMCLLTLEGDLSMSNCANLERHGGWRTPSQSPTANRNLTLDDNPVPLTNRPSQFTTLTERPLPVILLAEISKNMKEDGKIEELNDAVNEMLRSFVAESFRESQILFSVVTFGLEAQVHLPEAQVHLPEAQVHLPLKPVSEADWTPMEAAGRRGPADAGLSLVREMLETLGDTCKPTIILVSDGSPYYYWEDQLNDLLRSRHAARARRFALAVGSEVDRRTLNCFLANPKDLIFVARESGSIKNFLRFVTMTVIQQARDSDEPGYKATFPSS